MELFVISPNLRFTNLTVGPDSTVSDLISHFAVKEGVCCTDFYVKSNGRVSDSDDPLQSGVVYRLEPRLRGGKGGFGSMLRALGAQIEKTTNREACRDLSGRRLRDVNHEKEMAEWLKKQSDREAEKEQRRLERIQRKLAEPKHYFTDPKYEQQCHDLSERLEDSVLKGMQASSSGLVQADEKLSRKRPSPTDGQKKAKKTCFWSGIGELEDMGSSGEGSDDSDSEGSPSTSGASCSSDISKPAVPASTTRGSDRTEPQGQPSSTSSSSSSPTSSPTHNQEEVQEEAEKERTADDISQNSSTEEKLQVDISQNGSTGEKMEVDISQNIGTEEEKVQVDLSQNRSTEEKVQDDIIKNCSTEQKLPVAPTEAQSGPAESSQALEVAEGPLDLLSASGPEQLEALGLERLKKELMERGMKCGGTLQERAARLFSVRGLAADQIDPALLAKASKAKGKKK
ncbi:replication stress response regulator SDE2 [Pimephales promelas]|uniref:replication stress response regulator SDE2 n=1 Tax=Pimephales promelas TaxID=90988 RepID=UPI0019555A47|nr:replication stress response regulator SDE2 [Pimephales promelas]KAG1939832.1 replication stress response regulator SDE2 [Pimephales promelas]